MTLLPPTPTIVRETVRLALDEDAGRGDLTTQACVEPGELGRAVLRARQELVVCGAFVLQEVYRQLDPQLVVSVALRDGAAAEANATIAELRGSAASILLGERVALNFMQRLSGVATLTRHFVTALPKGSTTRITDTRKTTPGLRAFERYAVRCGGGYNHRADLGAGVLIKDNHVAAAGGVALAIERARQRAPHTTRIECEVDSIAQLREALQAGADIVLLDNFDDDTVAEALGVVDGRAIVEVSGGISRERVERLGQLGVDAISVGALTHSAPACDLGLDWS